MKNHAAKRGRPASIDRDEALERAMRLFWRHGYETTSITQLTDALETTAPTLYRTFGDKKQLFLEAVERYRGDPEELDRSMESAPDSKTAARELLLGAAAHFTGRETPAGCLIASAAITGSPDAEDVRQRLADVRRGTQRSLRNRIERDIRESRLPEATDAEALAAAVVCTVQGFSTMARDGASRTLLVRIGEQVLSTWPQGKGAPERD